MNLTFCGVVQNTLVILELLSNLQCKIPKNPFIESTRCQDSVFSEFKDEYYRMVNHMKININPQVSKQIYQFTKQPSFNYINYFKFDIELMARFVLDRIEKSFENVSYDHFFNSINECNICDERNSTTSRSCVKNSEFKENFIRAGISLFNEFPLKIEKKKLETIDEFKKRNDINVFTNEYRKFLDMFDESLLRRIELQMKNMIRHRFEECCSTSSKTNTNKLEIEIKIKNDKNKRNHRAIKKENRILN